MSDTLTTIESTETRETIPPESIRQGETYSFTFSIDGDEGLTGTFTVMQYPGDTPTITRALTVDGNDFTGTLTTAETAALGIGQWFIHANITDSDEDIRDPKKLYVTKGWI